jgi:hypothetical protein
MTPARQRSMPLRSSQSRLWNIICVGGLLHAQFHHNQTDTVTLLQRPTEQHVPQLQQTLPQQPRSNRERYLS